MFEIPEAKRVRREDLNDSEESGASDSEGDAQLRAQLEAQLGQSLALDFETPAAPSKDRTSAAEGQDEMDEEEDAGPEEYDFCLFGGNDAGPSKVVLEDDKEPEGEGGFVAARPASFYLAQKPSQEQRAMYEFAAMTGDQVLARSSWRCWNMELPWKVTHITTMRKGSSGTPTAVEDEEKRKRPGKKRRIAIRVRKAAKMEKKAAAAKEKEEKEEALSLKKKRLNRTKKLRKREKEKQKKLAAQGGEGAAAGGDDDDSDGSG